MSQFKAILFDMDGTLVDTEPLHEEAWHDTLAPFNLKLSSDWFDKYTGSTDRILMTDVAKHYQLNLSVDELLIEKKNRFLGMAKTRSQTFDGVKEGLEILRQKYELALVTSSSREGAFQVLASTELFPYFKTIVTFDDVKKPKPDPEPYSRAAHFFGLSPKDCIAIEDSVSGTKSAKAAGCYTLGVLNSVGADKLGSADRIFNTTKDVMAFCKGFGA
jgi:HAD superfamily hydrolase (TIGR01509 family)